MTAREITYALTYSQDSPFYMRSHLVVPNVSWGMGFNHELDMLSISRSNYGTEIEIKISVADLIRDQKKPHGHFDHRIRQLYFAGPEKLHEAFFLHAPGNAGIITVYRNDQDRNPWRRYQCTIRRKPKAYAPAVPFKDSEIRDLLRLGNMRYWSLLGKSLKGGYLK